MTVHGRSDCLEGAPDPLGRDDSDVGRSWQNGDEFLATQPTDDIGRAHRGACHRGEQSQRFVAGDMTEAVVDCLEPIEIEHQHADRLVLLLSSLDQFSRRGDEATPVQ